MVGNSMRALWFPAVFGGETRSGFDTFPRGLPASSSCPAPQGEGWQCPLEHSSLSLDLLELTAALGHGAVLGLATAPRAQLVP